MGGEVDGERAVAVTEAPQLSQNAAPAVSFAPQDEQAAASFAPHPLQNLAPSLLSPPQDTQSNFAPLALSTGDVIVRESQR